jgi:hypothetical protein
MNRYFKIFGIIFGILIVTIYFHPQLYINPWLAYTAWEISSNTPQLDQAPILLKLSPTEENASVKDKTIITYEGYMFQIPWKGSTEKYDSGNLIVLKSPKGSIIFTQPSKATNLLELIKGQEPGTFEKFVNMLGEKSVESNYQLCITALSILPSEVSVFDSTEELVIEILLLSYKGILVSSTAESGLYYFKTNESYGIQCGTPSKSERITLSLFNDSDEAIQLLITNKNNQITQEDINNILKSFKKNS